MKYTNEKIIEDQSFSVTYESQPPDPSTGYPGEDNPIEVLWDGVDISELVNLFNLWEKFNI